MSDNFISLFLACTAMAVLVVLALVPLLAGFLTIRERMGRFSFWGILLGSAVGAGLIGAGLLNANRYAPLLVDWGRISMSVVHLLLGLSFLAVTLFLLLKFWPKGGAVALAAFQEGVRQPLYWAIWIFAALLIGASPIIPYFTFGEDLKMVKQICFALTMLAPAAFGVIAASISVSEEIEGRTAVTLLSKPISRRQFLLGKYVGILLAALGMTVTLGWWLSWVVLYKKTVDARLPASSQFVRPDATWPQDLSSRLFGAGGGSDFARGAFLWAADFAEALPSLVIGFCLVMVLLAIAVALGTRLPMVINIPACIIIFFLGNLTPILREVTRNQYALIHFVAGVFQTILPGLDLFDVGSANIRDLPLPLLDYSIYTFHAFLYAVTYSAIALLFGLILFEDRDVA